MKNILKALLVSTALITASCAPAHAISNVELCYGAADIAVLSSRMHYANLELQTQGKEPVYSKERSQSKYSDFPWQYRPIYLSAVEYGFDNPSVNRQHVHDMAYSKCMEALFASNEAHLHWMHMNGY